MEPTLEHRSAEFKASDLKASLLLSDTLYEAFKIKFVSKSLCICKGEKQTKKRLIKIFLKFLHQGFFLVANNRNP